MEASELKIQSTFIATIKTMVNKIKKKNVYLQEKENSWIVHRDTCANESTQVDVEFFFRMLILAT